MMENTKIQFSAEELGLMQNAEWILTKNRIIEKIIEGFNALAVRITTEVSDFYPDLAEEISSAGYKVSRGENYQGLPYLMLDFPRIFGREEVLAIRVMFWWGKYFSITLHTKGRYAGQLCKLLLSGNALLDNTVVIANAGDEWNHDIDHRDYKTLNEVLADQPASLKKSDFIKLSKRVELSQWEEVKNSLHAQVHQYLACCNAALAS